MKITLILKTIILTSLTSLVLTSCMDTKEVEKEWTSFVYPDKQNKKRSVKIGVYESLEQCQEASKKKLIEIQAEKIGFYKCGYGCAFNKAMKSDICKRMEE